MKQNSLRRFLFCAVLFVAALKCALTVAVVRLTQETPCMTGGPCLLKCSLVSGTNQGGLTFQSEQGTVVACANRDSCVSVASRLYNFTQVDHRSSYVEILNFSTSLDVGNWSCRENVGGSTPSNIQVLENILPSGQLTFGSTCSSGRVSSPAPLTCSGLSPGQPNATLTLEDSSSQSVASSQTGSVTGTVTRGGQATCSVSWTAFPNYSLNISPVQCEVLIPPSTSLLGDRNKTVLEGQPLSLTCDSTGHPSPLFTWSRDGFVSNVQINSTTTQGSLTLTPNGSGGNSQTVTCTASNPAGSDSASFSLNVQYLPPTAPVVSGLPPDGDVYEGDDVSLTCRVTGGNPSGTHVTLTCPRGHAITSEGDVARLEFTAGRGDQGACVCSASHVLGYTQTATVSISVFWPPSPPTGLQAASMTSHSVTLSWLTADTGNAPERWYRVDFRKLVALDDQWSEGGRVKSPTEAGVRAGTEVQGLAPSTVYVFRVRARNSHRRDDVTNGSVKVVAETSAPTDVRGDCVASVATSVVVTSVVSVLGTFAVTYVTLRHRQKRAQERGKSTVYENAEFEAEMTSAVREGTEMTSRSAPEEGGYSVLDLASRERPRDAASYQTVARGGRHDDQQSRDSGSHDNQAYANVPGEGVYTSPIEL